MSRGEVGVRMETRGQRRFLSLSFYYGFRIGSVRLAQII